MINFLGTISSTIMGFFLTLFAPTHTLPTQCAQIKNVKFCYYQGHPASQRVVYFLHGYANNGEAWGWNPVTERIEKEWSEQKTPKPHVVSMSLGKYWWYTKKAQGKELEDFLVHFEKERGLKNPQRVLYGDSMGGHNSLRWAADYPALFNKLALICPALPYSFVNKFEGHEGLWPFNEMANFALTRSYAETIPPLMSPLKDQKFWDPNHSIHDVHIIISTRDHFGFYAGGKELYQLFKARADYRVSLEEQDIRHCLADAKKLSAFMIQ